MRYAIALAAIALIGASARAESPRAILPAMAAVEAGSTVAFLAPDLRSVLAVDAEGKRRWRVPIGDQGGIRDLDRLGRHVLVYAGTEALLVAADSGKVLGRRAGVTLGTPGGPRGCRLREEEGVCALDCECSFEVVSCDDLHALGPPAQLPHFEEIDADHSRQSRCPIFSGALLGRSGDVLITRFPSATDKPFFAVPEVTLARDARTGAEVWRSDALGFYDAALSGVGRDGICFAGERAGSVVVFDCQRGSILWRRAAMSRGAEPQVEATEQGLFVRDGPRAMLLGWRDGQARWEVVLPLDRLALVAASPTPGPDRRFGNAVRGARWLAPDDGRTLADLAFLPGADRWPRRSTAGWWLLAGKRLEGFGPSGSGVGGVGSSSSWSDFVVGDGTRVAAWDRDAVTLADLGADRPITTLDERARVVAFDGAFGRGNLALYVDGKGPWKADDASTFGELRLYRWP